MLLLLLVLFRKAISKDLSLVNLKSSLRRLNPINYSRIIKSIFRFHEISEVVLFESQHKDINSKQFRTLFAKMLLEIKKAIDYITGADVSVEVKLFVADSFNLADIKKTYALTYERILSIDEHKRIEEGILSSRLTSEKYLLTSEIDISEPLDDFVEDMGYLSVFKNPPSWLSNNLEKDVNNGKYKSNAKDWTNYYKSKGIFIIWNKKQQIPIGSISIDSISINKFDKLYIPLFMEYFACRLYYPVLNIFDKTKNSTY